MSVFKYLLIIGVVILGTVFGLGQANAANGFQAGRIIDDGIFFTGPDISAANIQQFLNSKVPACDTYHTQTGSANDSGPPYTCLKDYRQDTPIKSAESDLCNQYNGGNQSAAEIIYSVSAACGINPRVLIVLLEKEQSLITDTWPWTIQYRSATGYGCPDTAACDSQYYGFFNQVYNAARQFKKYVRDASQYGYRAGRTNYIQYNPNAACGGSNVFIETHATAALYNYTPYQPNPSALANMYGSGDGCGAYGNRNFWRLYNDWFGPTTSDTNSDALSFIRLNHSSGNIENLTLTSISNYSFVARTNFAGYPAVSPDGAVVPLYWPNGDLVFIRMNHGSGRTELISYSKSSGFQQMINYRLTGYPAVAIDGAVKPLFKPNGDLSFIRLNHGSGKVEVVTYSAASGFQNVVDYRLAAYPAVSPDGAVVPLYWPNGDLVFIRMNHGSGKTELVSYSGTSGFQQMINYRLTGYPAVAIDGAVKPLFKPNGDLSFIRLNHDSGKVEAITYSAASGFQQTVDHRLIGYPAIPPDGAVVPLYTR